MQTTSQQTACTLTSRIGDDKIIYLEMGGDVVKEHLDEFKRWGDDIRGAMVEISLENNKKVLTLIDITNLERIDIPIVYALHELMTFNKRYATRTAVYGAKPLMSAVTHSAIVVTGRFNMKLFPTRETALAWLVSGDTNVQPKEHAITS